MPEIKRPNPTASEQPQLDSALAQLPLNNPTRPHQRESTPPTVPEARIEGKRLIIPTPPELIARIKDFQTEYPSGKVWLVGLRNRPPVLYLDSDGEPLELSNSDTPEQLNFSTTSQDILIVLNPSDGVDRLESPVLPLAQIQTPRGTILLLTLIVNELQPRIKNQFFTGEWFRATPAAQPDTKNAILARIAPNLERLYHSLLVRQLTNPVPILPPETIQL